MPTTLTRWDPFAELAEPRTRFERLFDDAEHRGMWTPAIDLVRENGHVVLRADVPGIKPEEIEIEVENRHALLRSVQASAGADRSERRQRPCTHGLAPVTREDRRPAGELSEPLGVV